MLTMIPAAATTTTSPPSTLGGWISLLTASTATIPLTTSSVMPLAAAARISARFQPNVQAPGGGPGGQPDRPQRAADRPDVRQHVPRIREQRQRSRDDGGDHLAEHEQREQHQGGQQVTPVSVRSCHARVPGVPAARVIAAVPAAVRPGMPALTAHLELPFPPGSVPGAPGLCAGAYGRPADSSRARAMTGGVAGRPSRDHQGVGPWPSPGSARIGDLIRCPATPSAWRHT